MGNCIICTGKSETKGENTSSNIQKQKIQTEDNGNHIETIGNEQEEYNKTKKQEKANQIEENNERQVVRKGNSSEEPKNQEVPNKNEENKEEREDDFHLLYQSQNDVNNVNENQKYDQKNRPIPQRKETGVSQNQGEFCLFSTVNEYTPTIDQELQDEIDDYSESFFYAFNQLRANPSNFLNLAKEFKIEKLFKEAIKNKSYTKKLRPQKDYYRTLKSKSIEYFEKGQGYLGIISNLRDSKAFINNELKIYLGRYELKEKMENLNEWMDYCRRGVCDILAKNNKVNLLVLDSYKANICCVINKKENVVNSVLVFFDEKN